MVKPIVVNSQESLGKCIKAISEQFAEHKWLRVSVKAGKERTVDQNALSFQLYTDIHQSMPESYPTVNDARAYCKLHLGVPIRRQEPDFNEIYCKMIRDRFTYEEKLQLMLDPVDFAVTRNMSRPQFKEFVEAVKREFPSVYFRPFETD